ncbi:hypothetical protein EDD16DRAFT_1548837 [Pisolithus croceorrhizus]|nr:hypothetical protein EDD16DRAFT_1548837 [Pisolithus croceorrhizus]
MAAVENLPLFMKSLPADSSDDIAVQALQSLAHEGTPDASNLLARDCPKFQRTRERVF